MVRYLLGKDIEANIKDSEGRCALECLLITPWRQGMNGRGGFHEGRIKVLEIFDGHPEARRAEPSHGGNYLHCLDLAITDIENARVVEMLLSWDLDPSQTNDAGSSALHIAADSNDSKFDILLPRVRPHDLTQQDLEGRTILHILVGRSVWSGDSEHMLSRVRKILDMGADVKIMNNAGETPLDCYVSNLTASDPQSATSSRGDHTVDGILVALAAHGARLDRTCHDNNVMLALLSLDCVEDANLLLSLSPSASIRTKQVFDFSLPRLPGMPFWSRYLTLSFFATRPEFENDLVFLRSHLTEEGIANKGDWKDSKRCKGPFAAICALQHDPYHTFAALAIDRAVRERDTKTISIVKAVSSPTEAAVVDYLLRMKAAQVANEDDRASVGFLLHESGLHTSLKGSMGRSLLSFAAEQGRVADVQCLLECKAPLEEEDNAKRTALYWAAKGGNVDVVKLLVDHGAKITAPAREVAEVYKITTISEFFTRLEVSEHSQDMR